MTWVLLLSVVAAYTDASPTAANSGAEAFFETHVRPVLAEKCFSCHGPKKQNSGLRLDSREAMLRGGEGGPALAPGDPVKSRLLQAVRQENDLSPMPPRGKLSEPAIAHLTEWVQMGAPWPAGAKGKPGVGDVAAINEAAKTHWSFQPVGHFEPPAAKETKHVLSSVDQFIVAKQDASGLAQAAPADRTTLIRRATFDLIGLPPTPEEVQAFNADHEATPKAFSKVVERLLASPHYGERWGRYWLDVARYADTKGYVFTEERRYPFSFTYRDWVIGAFNADMPYDRFLLEQIAADQLQVGGDKHALAAMGFLTVGRRFLQDQQEINDDRIDLVTRGLLGLTVSCARCHDHKFDPIPAADYYSLYGVFASSNEPKELPVIASKTRGPEERDFERQFAEKQKALNQFLTVQRPIVEERLRSNAALLLQTAVAMQAPSAKPDLRNLFRSSSLSPPLFQMWFKGWKRTVDQSKKHGSPILEPWNRFAALPADEFAAKAPGVVARLAKERPEIVSPALTQAFSEPPRAMADVARRYGELITKAAKDTKLAETLAPLFAAGGAFSVLPESIESGLNKKEKNELVRLKKVIEELQVKHPGAIARAMVMVDNPQPMQPVVFLRGNPNRPGKPVPRQFLSVIEGTARKPFVKGSGRLELAQAIVKKNNPLTARVLVNRVWLHHFGAGLVRTPSDFGLRSDPPTHPELLDYLAEQFVAGGWSIKSLHRLLMNSYVYQQSSIGDPANLASDPDNRLLWKFNRQRLDWEATRDALLAAAGKLDPSLGGHPAPLFTEPFTTRRTVYGFIDRQNLDGPYRTFDFATPDATNPQRFVTTVPQQALFLMNSKFVQEQARNFAERPAAGATDSDRVQQMFERAFGRPARAHEMQLVLNYLKEQSGRDASAPPAWRYGFGAVNPKTGKTVAFHPFAHWTGAHWQFAANVPSPAKGVGYLQISAGGGHPGGDLDHSTILRWTSPADMSVSIEGELGRASKEGDGVRGVVSSSRKGLLGAWRVHGGKSATNLPLVQVSKGETLDFVLECIENDSFDSYTWAPAVTRIGGVASDFPRDWRVSRDFAGPAPAPPSPWERLAQALMMTNEFVYID